MQISCLVGWVSGPFFFVYFCGSEGGRGWPTLLVIKELSLLLVGKLLTGINLIWVK